MSILVGVHLENVKTGRIASRVHAFQLGSGNRTTACGLDVFLGNPAVQFSVTEDAEEINCSHCQKEIQ